MREQILNLLRSGYTVEEIADELTKHLNDVSKEYEKEKNSKNEKIKDTKNLIAVVQEYINKYGDFDEEVEFTEIKDEDIEDFINRFNRYINYYIKLSKNLTNFEKKWLEI
jgi:IS30 family transposase